MGALRPPTTERRGAFFGLCHDARRPFFQKPMSAKDQKIAAGRSPLGGFGGRSAPISLIHIR